MVIRLLAFLCFLIFCAAFFGYYWSGGLIANSATDMLATAHGFLDDIGNDRMEGAYARMSARFHKERTLEQFRALIDKYPVLKSQPTRQMKEYQLTGTWTGGKASFAANIQAAKESLPIKLSLVTEEAVWKVDDLVVPAK